MSRAGFRHVHRARCTAPTCRKPCEIAHGPADEDQLYRIRLISRCPHCGADGLELLPGDQAARVSDGVRLAVVGR
jgi:hypothetical protein